VSDARNVRYDTNTVPVGSGKCPQALSLHAICLLPSHQSLGGGGTADPEEKQVEASYCVTAPSELGRLSIAQLAAAGRSRDPHALWFLYPLAWPLTRGFTLTRCISKATLGLGNSVTASPDNRGRQRLPPAAITSPCLEPEVRSKRRREGISHHIASQNAGALPNPQTAIYLHIHGAQGPGTATLARPIGARRQAGPHSPHLPKEPSQPWGSLGGQPGRSANSPGSS
jgi:hypothetical protein